MELSWTTPNHSFLSNQYNTEFHFPQISFVAETEPSSKFDSVSDINASTNALHSGNFESEDGSLSLNEIRPSILVGTTTVSSQCGILEGQVFNNGSIKGSYRSLGLLGTFTAISSLNGIMVSFNGSPQIWFDRISSQSSEQTLL
jgi:hypothetical protein